MVLRHLLALIAGLMLFIYDDHPKVFKRRKKCRPGAYHYVKFTGCGTFILVVTFPLRQPGMDHGYPVAEPPIEAHQCLESKGNLRNEHYGLPAVFYGIRN